MPLLLDALTGSLPLGRHACTTSEIEETFVKGDAFSGSTTRQGIWNDWNDALTLLQSAVTVHAVWIGGSFTTSKIDPGDIDVTYIVNADTVRALQSEQDKKIVTIFSTPGKVKSEFGLNVDSYLIFWECVVSPLQPGMNPFQDFYYRARGHWDDWWKRSRQGPKGIPLVPADAIPRRGYLEVAVSDYLT